MTCNPVTDLICLKQTKTNIYPPDPTSGKPRVVGKPKGLKGSQAYPIEYARSVFREWDFHETKRQQESATMGEDDSDSDCDTPWAEWYSVHRKCLWPEAELEELAEFLNIPMDKPLPMM